MTDMVMAKRSGVLAVMVLTGEATREDVRALPEPERPDVVVDDIGLLVNSRQIRIMDKSDGYGRNEKGAANRPVEKRGEI